MERGRLSSVRLCHGLESLGLVKRKTQFTSKCPANEIVTKIEAAAGPMGFDVKKNNYKMKLLGEKSGRKGQLPVTTEVFQVTPSLYMVEMKKSRGDALEFDKVIHASFTRTLPRVLRISFEKQSMKRKRKEPKISIRVRILPVRIQILPELEVKTDFPEKELKVYPLMKSGFHNLSRKRIINKNPE
ncbi:hypothetical protein YC2023_020266 [Brassica napus]